MKQALISVCALCMLWAEPCPADTSDNGTCPEGYAVLFDHDLLHDIEIVISQQEWDGLVQDMHDYIAGSPHPGATGRTGNYRKADFIYTGPAGDRVIEEVGFRTKGRATRIIPQDDSGRLHRAHFKIKFNKPFDLEEGTDACEERRDREFCSMKELVLRLAIAPGLQWDASQIRELYCYDLINRAGAFTSRTGSARLTVTIGGRRYNFGIYTLMEHIDKPFLTKRFGTRANDGNLYKCLVSPSGPASLEPLDAHGEYWFRRLFPDDRPVGIKDWESYYYPSYDLKTNKSEADHSGLLDFIDNLDRLSGNELREYLDRTFEVDRFLRYLAINVLVGKWDDYWSMGNNYYLYFNNAGKIDFITSDYDMALGGGQMFYDASTGIYEWSNHLVDFIANRYMLSADFLNSVLELHSPLVEKMLAIPQYRAGYETFLEQFIDPSRGLFVYSDYKQRFDRLRELYGPCLDNDIDENEQMINEETTGRYFFEKTQTVIADLGLEENGYETQPVSLDAPAGVSASDGAADTEITVVWEPVLFADHYSIYRSERSGGPLTLLADRLTDTVFTDTPVAASTTWYYSVRAFSAAGIQSPLSRAEAGCTNDGTVQPPRNVSATRGTYRHIVSLLWDPVLNADYYQVYRADSDAGSYSLISGPVFPEYFDDTAAVPNMSRYYRVKGFSDSGCESPFSDTAAGHTGDDGLPPPVSISAEALAGGRYSRTCEYGTETYVFYTDGTCTKTAYNPLDPDAGPATLPGQWHYRDTALIIETSTTVGVMGGLTIAITETWNHAFTTDNGSRLILMGLEKNTGTCRGILGGYRAAGAMEVLVTVGDFFSTGDTTAYREEVKLCDNGTLSHSYREENAQGAAGAADNGTRPWTPDDNRLIRYMGRCFLPPQSQQAVFTRRPAGCPVTAVLGETSQTASLRRVRTRLLQDSRSAWLAESYSTHAAEILQLLERDPALAARLKDIIRDTAHSAEAFLQGGDVTIGPRETGSAVAFLEQLRASGSGRLQEDIDAVLSGMADGGLLPGVSFRR